MILEKKAKTGKKISKDDDGEEEKEEDKKKEHKLEKRKKMLFNGTETGNVGTAN